MEFKFYWILDSSFAYSEPGQIVNVGDIKVNTSGIDPYVITLRIDYSIDLNYSGSSFGGSALDRVVRLDSAPTPYKLIIENGGRNTEGNTLVLIGQV